MTSTDLDAAGAAARDGVCWVDLDAGGKRARLLAAAGEVFAREGLHAPIPVIAAAAGAGIGSVYRQFPSKDDLLAALVTERLEESRAGAERALTSDGSSWEALVALLWELAERQAGDEVLGEAMAMVPGHPDVEAAFERTLATFERLLAAARKEGRLRADASAQDLRLLFAATRAAGQIEAGAWRRMLALGIDALAASPPDGRAAPARPRGAARLR